ncbi:ribosome biogenesis factor YjgA [Thiohalomonas denitrificans]|uniref:ribosome biogenesis factor YjgA n=1 Tax=Thiohalomonas denitrificans TaxID=415747 RepID=UPI0026E9F9FE|nr:ribosome biogenesis factor YjgA [Thiohalomonas denitrificans]
MNESDFESGIEEQPEPPSKGHFKRESHALLKAAYQLVELPDAKLQLVPMSDDLKEAVELGRKINKHGGRKRQIKYIGKLLRSIDAEPIMEALETVDSRAAAATARHHLAERWRERLLDEGDTAVGEFVETYPQVDRQHLRQLMRNARAERKSEKPPRHSRELFRLVRDTIEGQT